MLFGKMSEITQENAFKRHAAAMEPLALPKPAMPKLYLVAGALVVAGFAVWGICHYTGGDMTVLRQRLLGEVKLSSGIYPARSIHELNALSWDNGLSVLETLDNLNVQIQDLEKLQANPKTSPENIARAQTKIRESQRQVDALLTDQKILLQTAGLFKSHTLYTPVYQEYLHDTLAKLSSLNVAQTQTATAPREVHEVQ